jgi:Mg2+ and Co2+ transporter CorA
LTGHGSWGTGQFEAERDTIPELTAELASALNSISTTFKHLNAIESIFDHMETIRTELADDGNGAEYDPDMIRSTSAIMSATKILRRQVSSMREQATYLELRNRNGSQVVSRHEPRCAEAELTQHQLFSILTHEDAKINIDVANASQKLADEARRDGSSMKTIAIVTMLFLPATYFAALFAMPSVGWDNRDKFGLYWACVIPTTLAVFVAWAAITQRELITQGFFAKQTASRKAGEKGNSAPGPILPASMSPNPAVYGGERELQNHEGF